MILYFAGNLAGSDPLLYRMGVRNKLLTFAEIDEWGKQSFAFWLYNKPDDVRIFMDCGAFSALSRGAVIDLDRYIKFCHQYRDKIDTYVQLDKIGDPTQTSVNLGIMEREGLTPIPVHTSSAPISHLEQLCEKYRHIALGGLRAKDGDQSKWRRNYFNQVMTVAEKYWPVKFHAFGVTTQWMLERYPLHSADSTSAILGAGLGRVLTFEKCHFIFGADKEYVQRTLDCSVLDSYGERAATGTESAHLGRRRKNIDTFLKFERHINELWDRKFPNMWGEQPCATASK